MRWLFNFRVLTATASLALFAVMLWLVTAESASMQQSKEATSVFSQQTVKYGAKHADVYELQGRLKFLGFFKGSIDGKYGWQTLQAVRTFQSRFGLPVDGVVGAKTKLKLWQATKTWRPSASTPAKPKPVPAPTSKTVTTKTVTGSSHAGLSANDLKLMANAVYGEARGEPYVGQVAVAAVILNRLESASFPKTISGIIFQPGAFTAVADGQIWLEPNDKARKAVQDAINGFDPSGGALYYFNPVTATSKWIWTRPQIMQIGKHIFCM